MITRDVFYVPPKLRIEINEPCPITPAEPDSMRDEMWRFQREVEGKHIWGCVKSSAEASNIGARDE